VEFYLHFPIHVLSYGVVLKNRKNFTFRVTYVQLFVFYILISSSFQNRKFLVELQYFISNHSVK
jgi:hypothetical protein